MDLKDANTLTTEMNSSIEYVWEHSALLQHQFRNAFIPCVTMNIPSIPEMLIQGTLNLQVSVKDYNPSTNLYFTKHEYKQLRHSYQIDQSVSYQLLQKNEGHTEYLIQTESIHLKMSRYDCFEDNSMYFKECIEDFIAQEIGCHLPWTRTNGKAKVCKNQAELEAFRHLSSSMISHQTKEKIAQKGCFKPNCKQTTWIKNQFIERWERQNETFLLIIIPPSAKVLQRKEVLLADGSTFVADCGSYLGLFLGASVLTLADLFITFIKRMVRSCKCGANGKNGSIDF